MVTGTSMRALARMLAVATLAGNAVAGSPLAVGTDLVLREREPVTGAIWHETRLVVSAVQPDSVAFNDGEFSVWRHTAVRGEGPWLGATLSGFDAGPLQPGDRVVAQFRPASPDDEAVAVDLRVEREEPVAVGNDHLILLRVRLGGYAPHAGPRQHPTAWRGARMSGLVWIERTSGLVVRAVVDCSHPSYAWTRELVRAAPPVARP